MLRGRLVRLGEVPAEKANVAADVRWVLDGDRGITFAPAPPANNTIVAGQWWPADYAGPPLVSFDGTIAEGLHLKLGDKVTVNVLGRDVTAAIANFRKVEWRTLSLNSVMIFSPDAFRGAPFGSLASLAWPDGGTLERETRLLKTVTSAFPEIAAVHVRDAVATVDRLVTEIAWAVRGASAITLAAAILVLGGAFAAGRHRRIHDVVVLKTLGATRPEAGRRLCPRVHHRRPRHRCARGRRRGGGGLARAEDGHGYRFRLPAGLGSACRRSRPPPHALDRPRRNLAGPRPESRARPAKPLTAGLTEA